jgi:glucose/arabinose dehydrogenase
MFVFMTLLSTAPVCTAMEVQRLPLHLLKLPPGFNVDVFAYPVPNARSLTLGDEGIVYAGSRNAGAVYALIDKDHDGKAEQTIVIAHGLNSPVGVAWRKGSLYVAEIGRVIRFDNISRSLQLKQNPTYVVVNDSFPKDTWHGWKFIAFGPDEKLYVPIGSPCNVCIKSDKRYGTIMRMNSDGKGLEVFASGIRNSVGFAFDPKTNDLWFTDNGRDYLGDNIPPDELNHAPKQGMHFGFPYVWGDNRKDPEFGQNVDLSKFTMPAVLLDAHVAALGMRFYTGTQFPKEYQGKIFIAEHGSWNRSTPIGYRVRLVDPSAKSRDSQYQSFLSGFLPEGQREPWGRPVDVLVMPDGSMLVSDDYNGAIYRISYKAQPAHKPAPHTIPKGKPAK